MTDITESGQSELSIEERRGAIVLMLKPQDKNKDIAYAIMPPEQAQAVGMTLSKYAYHAETGIDMTQHEQMLDKIRTKLQSRIPLVTKSMERKKRTPVQIANEIVDIFMRDLREFM